LQQRDRQVVLQLHPGVGVAGSASKFLEDDLAGLPQLGVRRTKIELLEQVKRFRLGASEVVPRVLPAKSVEALVEVFRLQALLGTNALDLVVGVDAMGAARLRATDSGSARRRTRRRSRRAGSK
jgi:hypothetical protein